MVEIERKFKVLSEDYKALAQSRVKLVQGYLNSDPERTVRIRIAGESGFLTIKGKSNDSGTTRLEWETEISLADARPLLKICEPGVIEKFRYTVEFKGRLFEVDEFSGENAGLVIAEVELSDENENFERPLWLGEEVTGDEHYYNSYLSKKPYSSW